MTDESNPTTDPTEAAAPQRASVAEENFDLSEFDTADEDEMTVLTPDGKLTNWKWRFAGPGHQQTIAFREKMSRKALHEERMANQAAKNGRKWKEPEVTPEQRRRETAELVVGRLLGWSAITMHGDPFPFSEDNAYKILLDPRKQKLLTQALEFVGDDQAFTKRSETS